MGTILKKECTPPPQFKKKSWLFLLTWFFGKKSFIKHLVDRVGSEFQEVRWVPKGHLLIKSQYQKDILLNSSNVADFSLSSIVTKSEATLESVIHNVPIINSDNENPNSLKGSPCTKSHHVVF